MKNKKHIIWRILWLVFLAWIFLSAALVSLKLFIVMFPLIPGEAYACMGENCISHITPLTAQFIGSLFAFAVIAFIAVLLFFPLRKAFKNLKS